MPVREGQFLGRSMRSLGAPRRREGSGAPVEERGVWGSRGGERGLGLPRRREGSGVLKEEERTVLSTFLSKNYIAIPVEDVFLLPKIFLILLSRSAYYGSGSSKIFTTLRCFIVITNLKST